MSSFEIVGVILGSLPLLISALEHYVDGVDKINDIIDFEDVFTDLHSSFVINLSLYRQSCEELLSPLMLPNQKFSELLENFDGSAWKEEDLNIRLRNRLRDDYEPYKSATNSLNKKIQKFAKKLRLDKLTLKPAWVMEDNSISYEKRKKFFKNSWTRMRGGFSAERYATLLKTIDDDIERIGRLSKGAASLEAVRIDRSRKKSTSHWTSIRDQAKRLFDTLDSKWSYNCPDKHPHCANLRLDMRKEDDMVEKNQRFGLVLSLDGESNFAGLLPWTWRHVEIELLHTSLPTYNRIGSDSAGPSITVNDLSERRPEVIPSLNQSTRPLRIDNLCTKLKENVYSACCLGFLDDNPWEHHIYHSIQPNFDHKTKYTSLKEIICQSNLIGTKQKCLLAVTLASAVLQLHDTPWLSADWSIEDIYFMCSSRKNITDSDQLYVSRSFTSGPTPSNPVSAVYQTLVKNRIVFNLGVILLELSYGKPLLELKEPDDECPGLTEILIAKRLAQNINGREPSNYANAVIRCIDFNFGDRALYTSSLDAEELREAFYEGVTVPLWKNYEIAYSIC